MIDYRWEELAVGMQARFEVTLVQPMMDDFLSLSGDANPLHRDAEYARAAGFPQPVAFGLLTSAFYSQMIGVYLPGRRAILHGIDIDFRSPAFVGDTLTVAAEIVQLNDAYRRANLKASIVNQHGKVISNAKIRAGVRER
jgi:3-hydroxybutyryl-CoA dehydratase